MDRKSCFRYGIFSKLLLKTIRFLDNGNLKSSMSCIAKDKVSMTYVNYYTGTLVRTVSCVSYQYYFSAIPRTYTDVRLAKFPATGRVSRPCGYTSFSPVVVYTVSIQIGYPIQESKRAPSSPMLGPMYENFFFLASCTNP